MNTSTRSLFVSRSALASLVAALLLGCSAPPPQPPIETTLGPSPTDDAGLVAQADGGIVCPAASASSCNTQGLCGVSVYVSQIPKDPPVGAGGQVAAGTYVMTSYVNYTGAGGASGETNVWFREAFTLEAVSSGLADAAAGAPVSFTIDDVSMTNQDSEPVTGSGTFQLTGTVGSLDWSCPGQGELQVEFTATGTTLTEIFPQVSGSGTAVIQYALVR